MNEKKEKMVSMFERNILRDAQSPVFLEYCRRVHQVERFQYNSVTTLQFELLLEGLALAPGENFLDLGCATGSMTLDVARRTGATGLGVDFAPGLLAFARERTPPGCDVSFEQQDLDCLNLPPGSFDAVMTIDTLYFVQSLSATIGAILRLLKPGGRLVAFYSAFQSSGRPPTVLTAEGNPLGKALADAGVTGTWVDLTADDCEHWRRAVRATEELREAWIKCGERDGWESRHEENQEISPLVESGCSARFMVTARVGTG